VLYLVSFHQRVEEKLLLEVDADELQSRFHPVSPPVVRQTSEQVDR
jgi:hypothetical protein